MANLLSTGVSGLNAAQVALNTVGNNIANAGTDGYSREVVRQTERVVPQLPRYTVGGGVDVTAVERAYSSYLTQAVWTSNGNLQRANTYNDLAGTLNSMLGASGDLQGALDGLYGGFDTVANAPADSSARQAALGNAGTAASVFNTLGAQFASQQQQINGQIGSTVASINTALDNIASLNRKIHESQGGGAPNALLDQRDALVNTLSGYVGVTAVAQSDGTLSVYSSSGQALVSGSSAFKLGVANDAYDASRTNVFDSSGTDITTRLSGGSLGALLDYRANVLEPAQNRLGQAAIALATSVNAQQGKGLDLNGKLGAPIFSLPTPQTMASKNNTGSAAVGVQISNVNALDNADYTLRYDGSAWSMSTTAGQPVALTTNPDGTLSGAGLTLSVSGAAQAGDSFRIEPTRNAATGLAVAMTDPSGIAAAAAVQAQPAGANTGSAAVSSLQVTDPANAALFANVTVSFPTAGTYAITDSTSGTVLGSGAYTPGQALAANGWSLTLSGAPAAGDSFAVSANSNGLNDNTNALALSRLADAKVLAGGSRSVIDNYTVLTTEIGNAGAQAASNVTTQTSLHSQAMSAQQSVSGVNLDEEAASMVKYQQAYQASAQIISTAQSIFNSLLQAVHG
ncbi:MAG: flagellar hook-associated protein FlgK [Xanthomonadaceae bacterium]|nr:flagellar hook-associated protein FlgK [Xanthomonadaceae bacterium]